MLIIRWVGLVFDLRILGSGYNGFEWGVILCWFFEDSLFNFFFDDDDFDNEVMVDFV